MRSKQLLLFILLAGVLVGIGYYGLRMLRSSGRTGRLIEWLRHPERHPDWAVRAGTRCAPDAPFIMPTDGLIGYLWDDSFRPGHRHSGLDIFGGTEVGVTPVIAAYPGYLWRLPDWKSAVIVRVPSDPLQPGRQIWLYYTHMADPNGNSFISPEFPPGTVEKYIEAGTFLGYQGNYTGNPTNPSGVHLHFSIVLSDSDGKFLNELDIQNTLDPSPYFGIPLNAKTAPDEIIRCGPNNNLFPNRQ
ncbi:MAG: M23 family metallopeptidase [Anaerolineales bacterium]|nr:M23 family metallopeptidase [Anaerolineales bacterium]MDW8226795.1 hypothetical protein [Anaerolineales bacterium]